MCALSVHSSIHTKTPELNVFFIWPWGKGISFNCSIFSGNTHTNEPISNLRDAAPVFLYPLVNKSILNHSPPTSSSRVKRLIKPVRWGLLKHFLAQWNPDNSNLQHHTSICKEICSFPASKARLKPWKVSLLFPVYFNFTGESVSHQPRLSAPLHQQRSWLTEADAPSFSHSQSAAWSQFVPSCSLLQLVPVTLSGTFRSKK